MKIYYVTSLRLPNERGVSFGVVTMCRALAQTGNQVELVSPNQPQPSAMKGENIWHYHQISPSEFTHTKLPFLDLPVPHLHNLLLAWSFGLITLFHLARNKAKVVHLFNDAREILLLLKLVSWFYHPFVIFELHLLPIGEYERFLESAAIKRVNLLLVTTQRFAKYYQQQGISEDKTLVFPNGINLNEFDYKTPKAKLRKKLNLPLGAFIIGYAGRFVTMGMEKGIPELILATTGLIKKNSRVVLVCVGGPAELIKKYQEYARKLGLSPQQAIFVDNVPRGTLYQYMRAFNICAMPFPETEHFAYNMSPLKMFEYMASKNPIIATNLPSIKEILTDGKNALMAKPGDSKDLEKKIEKLIHNPQLSKRIATLAFTQVSQKYTWSQRAQAELARIRL